MRTRSLIGGVACLAALAGCSAVQHKAGDAAPAGEPAAASAAPPTTQPSTAVGSPMIAQDATADSSIDTGSDTVTLGPLGYNAVRLGMTKQQVDKTGLVVDYSTNGPNPVCPIALLARPSSLATFEGGEVVYSPDHHVVAISAFGDMETPQGVRLGTTSADMRKAYPEWTPIGTNTDGRGYAKVPGNPKAQYRIEVTNGKVSSLTLQANDQNCFE